MSSRVTADIRALVLHPTDALVLTIDGTLPSAVATTNVHDGAGVPELFASLTPGGSRFLRRLTFSYEQPEPDVWHLDGTFALEARDARISSGAWTPLAELSDADAALARLALTPDDRIPWWRRGWLDEALAWLDGALDGLGERRVAEPEFVRSWQISVLYRVRTTLGARYLKAVPEFFAREGRVTRWLHALSPQAAPPVLAARGDTLFLMASAGERPFEETDAPSVARRLAAVQRLAETRSVELRALGCEPRSLADLAADARALLASDALLRVGGDLTTDDIAALRALEPRFASACVRLADAPIPPSVVHGDLHAGNVVFHGDTPTFLDWSDAALSFPFLDANPAYFLSKKTPRSAKDAMRDAYLEAWTDLLPLPELRALHEDATLLGELYRAVSYVKFIAPHVPDPAEWADAHVWHLKRVLEIARVSAAPLPTPDAAAGTD